MDADYYEKEAKRFKEALASSETVSDVAACFKRGRLNSSDVVRIAEHSKQILQNRMDLIQGGHVKDMLHDLMTLVLLSCGVADEGSNTAYQLSAGRDGR